MSDTLNNEDEVQSAQEEEQEEGEEEEQDDQPAMLKAYTAVENGMSIRQAAKEYKVSYTSLHRRVSRGTYVDKIRGRKPWLSTKNEQDLVDWCLSMTKIGSPLTRILLPKVVKGILDAKKVVVFPPDNLPTPRWVDRFLKRHPVLSLRAPEHLGHLRAAVRPSDIAQFFKDLEKFLKEEHDIDAHSFLTEENGSRIFNCDESGFCLNATDKSSKVLVRKGMKNAYKYGGEDKKMMTVLSCVSADGVMYRPLILNQGKKPCVYERYPDFDSKSFNIGYSDSGWMTLDVFFSWLANLFHPELEEKKIQRPVLLFVDGHSSHLSFETLAFARDNGIIMFCFPAHASHIIQPLDVAVFKSVKQVYRTTVMQSRGTLTKGDLPKKTFPYVLMQAFKNSNMTENIKSGFRSTGLVPYNPSAIRKDKFLEATVDEEEDQGREETANEDNNPTEAEAFTKGWKEAQLDCLHRFEAIMSPDLIKLYKERLMHDVGSREYETLYYAWRELTQTPPCPNNPFSNFINSASPNHQSQDNPEEANRDEPFREPPIVSEVENTPVRTRPPPEESSPVAGPSHLPPIQAAAASVTAPSILGVELSESHSAKRRVLSSPPEHFEESPFKKYLRTPPLMQGKQAKRGKGRDKYPRALTALSFIEHLEKKEEAKRIAEQEKENRKKVREEKRLEKEKEKKK